MNLELTERIAQDELAFGFMREANTLLTADVKRLTAELEQCKHALDDEGEICECGHSIYDHTRKGGCFEPSEDDSGMTYCTCSKFEAAK